MQFDSSLQQFMPFLSGINGRWASFSNDLSWVAHVNYPEGSLWRSQPDGSHSVRLTPPGFTVTLPHWSPDGARIAVSGTQTGRADAAYLIPATGGAPKLVPGSSCIVGTPTWSSDSRSLLFSVDPPKESSARPGIYVVDLATSHSAYIPDSENLFYPTWSPDGRYVAAHRGRTELMLFDFRTGTWTFLARGAGLGFLYWSHDGKYVYYQETLGGPEQPISRVHVLTHKVEPVAGMRHIPQSNVTAYLMGGLGPGDVPIASVFRTNADLCSLDLETP